MAVQFGTDQARAARYHYERLPYTWGPQSLTTGTTPIVSAQKWDRTGTLYPEWQARLEWLESTQNKDVTLTYQADPQNTRNIQNPGYTIATRNGEQRQSLQIEAVQQLTMTLNNTSGAAISNWQLNYGVAMRHLMAADKVMRQQAGLRGYALNKDEVDAAVALGFGTGSSPSDFQWDDKGISVLVDKGTLPLSMDRLMPAIYENRILEISDELWYPESGTGDNSFATYNAALQTLSSGTFPVLLGIAVENSPNVTVSVDRDGQNNYLQVNGSAYVQTNDHAWDCWIPALDFLTFHVTNGSGNSTSANVAIRLKIATVAMSEVLAILYGRINSPKEAARPEVYYKILLGLI